MTAVRLLRVIAGVAGLGALTLGLLFWIANLNFIGGTFLLSVPDPYDIIGQYHFLCRFPKGAAHTIHLGSRRRGEGPGLPKGAHHEGAD